MSGSGTPKSVFAAFASGESCEPADVVLDPEDGPAFEVVPPVAEAGVDDEDEEVVVASPEPEQPGRATTARRMPRERMLFMPQP
jgi:hypothetical protein